MDRPEIVHTPYVIWGAGVSVHAAHNWKKFEEYKDGPLYWLRDNYFSEDKAAVRTWAAHIYEPHFIDQVDFAPLMVTPFSQYPEFTKPLEHNHGGRYSTAVHRKSEEYPTFGIHIESSTSTKYLCQHRATVGSIPSPLEYAAYFFAL